MTIDIQLNNEELKEVKFNFENKIPYIFLGKNFILEQIEYSPVFIGDFFDVNMIFKEVKQTITKS